jgi:copper oxidase (laccase) domain-containing protein
MIKADQPTIFGDRILAAVSSREDGNMSLLHGDTSTVHRSRECFFGQSGLQLESSVLMYVGDLTVWDKIYDVTPTDHGAGLFDPKTAISTDALVTDQPGIGLALPTADCSPVIVYDPANKVLALVHLGWQSTAAKLAGKVVGHLSQQYGSDPSDLLVYNGPAIHAESYTFDPPIAQSDLPEWAPYLRAQADGKISIDLISFNRQQFVDAGVLPGNIEICPVDTAASRHYFSNYHASRMGQGAREGRFVTVCALAP